MTRSKVTRSAALAQRRSLLRLCFDSAMGDWLVAGGSRKKSASRTSKEDAARTQHTELVRNFKTSLCTVDHGEDRVAARRCPRIHAWEDTSLVQRRPPFQPPYYEAEICPDGKWCDRGPQCPFAHSQFEVMFHPMRCRHGMCRDREACRRFPQCAFAHSEVEQTLAQIVTSSTPTLQHAFSASTVFGGARSCCHDRSGRTRLGLSAFSRSPMAFTSCKASGKSGCSTARS